MLDSAPVGRAHDARIFKIPNPKHEIRNKPKIRNPKAPNP
jgi:hypothetical protein